MNYKRVFPLLLLSNGGLWKTIKFDKRIYLGDPLNIVRIFNDFVVDEIFVIDLDSLDENYTIDYSLLEQMVSLSSLPITFGGGIRKIEDVDKLINIGIDRISVQRAFFNNINMLNEIVCKYGSQCLIVSLDLKLNNNNEYQLFNARNKTFYNIDLLDAVYRAVNVGVGEIFINFIDLDGVRCGMPIEFISRISQKIKCIFTVAGGSRSVSDIKEVLDAKVDGVGIGSFFVLYENSNSVLLSYPRSELLKIKSYTP